MAYDLGTHSGFFVPSNKGRLNEALQSRTIAAFFSGQSLFFRSTPTKREVGKSLHEIIVQHLQSKPN